MTNRAGARCGPLRPLGRQLGPVYLSPKGAAVPLRSYFRSVGPGIWLAQSLDVSLRTSKILILAGVLLCPALAQAEDTLVQVTIPSREKGGLIFDSYGGGKFLNIDSYKIGLPPGTSLLAHTARFPSTVSAILRIPGGEEGWKQAEAHLKRAGYTASSALTQGDLGTKNHFRRVSGVPIVISVTTAAVTKSFTVYVSPSAFGPGDFNPRAKLTPRNILGLAGGAKAPGVVIPEEMRSLVQSPGARLRAGLALTYDPLNEGSGRLMSRSVAQRFIGISSRAKLKQAERGRAAASGSKRKSKTTTRTRGRSR